jgi:hypothetical protein
MRRLRRRRPPRGRRYDPFCPPSFDSCVADQDVTPVFLPPEHPFLSAKSRSRLEIAVKNQVRAGGDSMSGVKHNDEIDIDEDLVFEQRQQPVQRISWVIGALIIAAALLGAFGHGPLSRGRSESSNGALAAHYERFPRNHAPARLRLEVRLPETGEDHFVVGMRRDYFESAVLRNVVPQPVVSEVASEELRFRFAAPDRAEPAVVLLEFEHQRMGKVKGDARLYSGGQAAVATFTQFVYP